jgi:hypothetical protein
LLPDSAGSPETSDPSAHGELDDRQRQRLCLWTCRRRPIPMARPETMVTVATV